MNNVASIRDEFVAKYEAGEFVMDKTGCRTIDIIGAQFLADEDHIFGKPDDDYIQREMAWYESMSLNVNDLERTPKIWKSIADKNGCINSNYGWCVYSEDNGKQYSNCLWELKRNPLSRRAVMIYNRPSMWDDYGRDGMSDFMCTFATQYFIRDEKLISLVYMRSNDSWAGFRNDLAWQRSVSAKLASGLDLTVGDIIWHAGSLHLYESQFYLLEHYRETGQSRVTAADVKSYAKA